MFCPQCGKAVETKDAKFCYACGRRLPQNDAPSEAPIKDEASHIEGDQRQTEQPSKVMNHRATSRAFIFSKPQWMAILYSFLGVTAFVFVHYASGSSNMMYSLSLYDPDLSRSVALYFATAVGSSLWFYVSMLGCGIIGRMFSLSAAGSGLFMGSLLGGVFLLVGLN